MKIHANGIDIHYEIAGTGPWVTFSHALSSDLSIWDAQVDALQDRYTVLRYDTRGHGTSSAPAAPYSLELLADDVLALWDALGVGESHYVGISMGGMIGQVLALRAPQRVKSLALADTTSRYGADAAPLWIERIRVVSAQGMEPMVDATLARWFTEGFRQARPEAVARIAALIRATPVAGYVGCCHALPRIDVTAQLSSLRCPALVIVGEQDQGTPPAMARAIADAIPGARLEVIPGAHLTNVEQAERFNRLLAGFLDSQEFHQWISE